MMYFFCCVNNRLRTRLGNLGSVLNVGRSLFCTTEGIDVSHPEPLGSNFYENPLFFVGVSDLSKC